MFFGKSVGEFIGRKGSFGCDCVGISIFFYCWMNFGIDLLLVVWLVWVVVCLVWEKVLEGLVCEVVMVLIGMLVKVFMFIVLLG